MGFGHRNCVVVGCPNSGKRLDKWASSKCELHDCNKGTDPCDCAPPFKLFAFPTELKNNEGRMQWALLINRREENGTRWMPKKSSRVCSEHFVSGKPTEENPDPILNLGYEPKLVPKRKGPSPRSGPPKKRKKSVKRSNELAGNADQAATNNGTSVDNPSTCSAESAEAIATETERLDCSPELSVEPECSSNLVHDHGYCYGWREMHEDPNYCMNTACLKIRQEKDAEIKELREEIEKLEEKLKWQKKQLEINRDKGLKHTDLKTDHSMNLLTAQIV